MQCIILVAGKGTRMRPLTEHIPKPLIKVCDKTLLDFVVDSLPEIVTEIILVTNYLEDQIKEYCGNEFHGRKVKYVTQENPVGGTGDALLCAKGLVTDKFLFMYGDDVHGKDALKEVVQEEHAMLGMYSETPELFGVLVQNDDGTLKEIIEKPENPTSNFINIGGFVVDPSIFDYVPPVSRLSEILATDMLTEYAKKNVVKIIPQDSWLPVGTLEQLEAAEAVLCPRD